MPCLTAISQKLRFLSSLRTLSTVLGASLHSLVYTLSVECTSDDVVTHTRKVLNTAATDQNNGVFLQFVSDTGNISCNFITVRKLNSGNLSHRGVRLLRGLSTNGCAHASLLGGRLVYLLLAQCVHRLLECRSLGFLFRNLASLADKLIKRWHYFTSNKLSHDHMFPELSENILTRNYKL